MSPNTVLRGSVSSYTILRGSVWLGELDLKILIVRATLTNPIGREKKLSPLVTLFRGHFSTLPFGFVKIAFKCTQPQQAEPWTAEKPPPFQLDWVAPLITYPSCANLIPFQNRLLGQINTLYYLSFEPAFQYQNSFDLGCPVWNNSHTA